jgi:hypothetical protein
MPKLFDNNRLRKNYPLIRVKPVFSVVAKGDSLGIGAEVAIVDFDNSFSEVYSFQKQYDILPSIALTPEIENVNVFISSISLATQRVTIESSAPFTGKVHIQVFESEEE